MNIVDILLKSSGIEPTTTYDVQELAIANNYIATIVQTIEGQDTHTGIPVIITTSKLFVGTKVVAEDAVIRHANTTRTLTVEELRKYI